MGILGGQNRPVAQLRSGTNPTIYNVSCPTAGTEYSKDFGAGVEVVKFLMRSRNGSKLKFSYVSGDTGIVWVTIPKGCSFGEESIIFTGSIYFQADTDNEVVEILVWT